MNDIDTTCLRGLLALLILLSAPTAYSAAPDTPSPRSAKPPMTLTVVWGVSATSLPQRQATGMQPPVPVATPAFIHSANRLSTNVYASDQGSAVSTHARLIYRIEPADNTGYKTTLALDTQVPGASHSTRTTVSLVPGQWLAVGDVADRSIATIDDSQPMPATRHEYTFVCLADAAGCTPALSSPPNAPSP